MRMRWMGAASASSTPGFCTGFMAVAICSGGDTRQGEAAVGGGGRQAGGGGKEGRCAAQCAACHPSSRSTWGAAQAGAALASALAQGRKAGGARRSNHALQHAAGALGAQTEMLQPGTGLQVGPQPCKPPPAPLHTLVPESDTLCEPVTEGWRGRARRSERALQSSVGPHLSSTFCALPRQTSACPLPWQAHVTLASAPGYS